jgi:thiol-disulfide isomerase/thioredoxin
MNPHRLILALALAAFIATPSGVLAADTHVKGDKPARIAMGEEVKLSDYLVPGKITIFDFTSQYCPPCRAIAPHVEKLHLTRDDIAVVSVDINRPDVKGIDWDSPVARQYEMHSIPHFKVFGPDGKLIAEGDKARALVTSWFK